MMKIIERGAVYDYNDKIIGFECQRCGRITLSMLGDYCNKCNDELQFQRELIRTLQTEKRIKEGK